MRPIVRSEVASAFDSAKETPDAGGLDETGTANVGYASGAIAVNGLAVTALLVATVEAHQNIDTPSPAHSQASFPYQVLQDSH